MKRLLGGAAVAVLALTGTALPAEAVHTNQKLCSSRNTTGGVIVWGKGYANPADKVVLAPGACTYLPSRDVPTMQMSVRGWRFRVGYDGGPYRAWQEIGGTKIFRPSDNNQIYFQAQA